MQNDKTAAHAAAPPVADAEVDRVCLKLISGVVSTLTGELEDTRFRPDNPDGPEAAALIRSLHARAVLAEAERDEARAELTRWRQVRDGVAELDGHGAEWPKHGNAPLAVMSSYALLQTGLRLVTAELDEARRLLAEAHADTARLDFLDKCNAALNAHYGTNYGWELILSHNVTRLVLGRGAVDLNDMAGGRTKLASCRTAIDRRMRERLEGAAGNPATGQDQGDR